MLTLLFLQIKTANAQSYLDLHDFGGTVTVHNGSNGPDGQNPYGSVTFGRFGNMYGTSYIAGPHGEEGGTVWEMTLSGVYIDLHDFGGTVINANGVSGPDGWYCQSTVAFDSVGNMYGTTASGGANFGGIIWEITFAGVYKDLHDFGGTTTLSDGTTGADGIAPYSNVTIDSAGNLYGTTISGGPYDNHGGNSSGVGIVWELSKAGTYKDLHDFGGTTINANGSPGPDGFQPFCGVTLDASGNLYGTTSNGGGFSNSQGMVWEITTSGTYLDIHDFGGMTMNANGTTGLDGQFPEGQVAFDSNGNMYGTAGYGGAYGEGILWELTTGGIYSDLYDFGGTIVNTNGSIGPDGAYPAAGVTFDAFGNIYGSTNGGGPNGSAGIIWELTPTGAYYDLHDFGGTVTLANGSTGTDGIEPSGPVAFDPSGNIVGMAQFGGPHPGFYFEGSGNLWMLTAGHLSGIALNPSTVFGGGSTTGTVTLTSPAAFGGVTVQLSSNNGGITVPSTVLIPAGAISAPFTVNTVVVSSVVTAQIKARVGLQTQNVTITVDPAPSLVSVTLNPAEVYGGQATSGTVTISAPALSGGLTINLSSNNGGITVHSTVTIPFGAVSAPFPVSTVHVSSQVTAKIFATLGSTTLHTGITVDPPATLVSVSLSPSTVFGATSTTGTVTLNAAALTGGVMVYLSSNNGGITVPLSVTVNQGSPTATFPVGTVSVSSLVTAKIAATIDNVNVLHTGITVEPAPILTGVTLAPSSVTGGATTTGTVTINEPALTGGVNVNLSSNNGGITVNTVVNIPFGAVSAPFTVNTIPVSTQVTAKIAGTLGNTTLKAGITVNPPSLTSVSVSIPSVQGSSTTQVKGTITLNGISPASGEVVTLMSSDPSVTVPPTTTVYNPQSSCTFPITHSAVTTQTTVTITATLGGVTQTTTITITP